MRHAPPACPAAPPRTPPAAACRRPATAWAPCAAPISSATGLFRKKLSPRSPCSTPLTPDRRTASSSGLVKAELHADAVQVFAGGAVAADDAPPGRRASAAAISEDHDGHDQQHGNGGEQALAEEWVCRIFETGRRMPRPQARSYHLVLLDVPVHRRAPPGPGRRRSCARPPAGCTGRPAPGWRSRRRAAGRPSPASSARRRSWPAQNWTLISSSLASVCQPNQPLSPVAFIIAMVIGFRMSRRGPRRS